MNLAYKYPIIFWNCACLIVNSSSGEEDDKATNKNYDKIAQALGSTIKAGINVSLADINKSKAIFAPDIENNTILYGLTGISNIGLDLSQRIIDNRPYSDFFDFYNKVKPDKTQTIALIKAGAFDNFKPRERIMAEYLWATCKKKKRITLQNMSGLIKYNLLPLETEEQIMAKKVYEFNRYLKDVCGGYSSDFYVLTDRANDFLIDLQANSLIEDGTLNKKLWEKEVYQKWMDVFRRWITDNKEEILDKLNEKIFMDEWYKYTSGNSNLSYWEMESICFYYHQHELTMVNKDKYGLSEFSKLPPQPIVERELRKNNRAIPLFKINKIAGTCIAKNKDKAMIYLLTVDSGVVPVKFRKEFFNLFDKQISQKNGNKKTIVERSWFNRGSKLIIQGIRRGEEFVAKKYSKTPGHTLYKIIEVDNNNNLILTSDRKKGELEEEEES